MKVQCIRKIVVIIIIVIIIIIIVFYYYYYHQYYYHCYNDVNHAWDYITTTTLGPLVKALYTTLTKHLFTTGNDRQKRNNLY